MKKTKLWVLLVFALAMGMVFGACDTGTGGGDNDGGDNTGKKLVITNVSGTIVREYISVFISRDAAIEDIVAYGDHFVVEGTTISTNDLYEASYDDGPEKVWTVVPGNYYVQFSPNDTTDYIGPVTIRAGTSINIDASKLTRKQ